MSAGTAWTDNPAAPDATKADEPSTDSGCQFSYWAPGIINQEAGSIEMDVIFGLPREEMFNDYQNLFTLSGNGGKGGNVSILSLVLCPPVDGRDLSLLATGPGGRVNLTLPSPPLETKGKEPSRLALSWGNGEIRLWFNGKLLGKTPFRGGLAQLPEKFRAGFALDSGLPAGFRIQALRISDMALTDASAGNPSPLIADEHTTFLAAGNPLSPVATSPTAWQQAVFQTGVFPVRRGSSHVVPTGDALELPLSSVNYTGDPVEFRLAAKVRDRGGETIAEVEQSLTIPSQSRYLTKPLSFPKIEKSGYYDATLTVTDAQAGSAVYDVSFVVQPRDDAKPGKLAEYLGYHHLLGIHPDAFSQLGIRWHRTWGRERSFLWCVVEPERGRFFWDATDRALREARRQGVEVLGVLGYPPAWASTYSEAERERLKIPAKPGTYSRNPERYQPKNIEDWKAYVRAVVERYRGQVKYWEIYNEVDFHPPAKHATFSGTTKDYLELLRSAHGIIREIDPDARVLTSGFSLSKGITDHRMPEDLLAMGGASAFDIFNVHGYSDEGTLREATNAVLKEKPETPLWMTEYMYQEPGDDYRVASKALWFLALGYDKFFLHGGELDRKFGELKITPYYAVTAELARQLSRCDAYLEPLEGTGEHFNSWKFRRTDGAFLNVFAVNNGKVALKFAEPAELLVTDLYGTTLFEGKWQPDRPFEISGMTYVISSGELKIAKAVREHGNVVYNGDFEQREGDILMDESLARPVAWDLRPAGTPPGAMGFAPGRNGKYALKLSTSGNLKEVRTGQIVKLDIPGEWVLSADVRISRGGVGRVVVEQNQSGVWRTVISERLAGAGQWEHVTVRKRFAGENTQAVVKFGLESGDSQMEIDNVQMLFAEKSPETEGKP